MKRITLTLFLVLSLFTIPGFSQEEKEEEEKKKDESQDYYVVVEDQEPAATTEETATKLPVPIQKTPASVGVVTEKLFESQAATNLGDALKNVSGVNVQSGFGTFDLFFVRGLDSLSSGLVLTDGAAEPETTYYQIYNVDRVEVLKGPGAFLYGGNPLSGTIQLIRKQPLFSNSLEIESSLGSFESYWGTIDWNCGLPEKDIAFRLIGTWQNADGYRDDKNSELLAFNPSLLWQIGPDSTLNINLEYVTNQYQPDAGLPLLNNEIPDVPRTNSYQSPFDRSEQDIYRIRLDYDRKINDWITFRNKFYYTDLDWGTDGTLPLGAFPTPFGNTLVFRTQTLLDDRQKLTGNQTEAIFSVSTGSVSHKIMSGFEISRLADEFQLDVALLPPIDLFNPVETATENPFLIPGATQIGDARSIVYAPYAVDQISFSDQLQIFAGGRLDSLDYEDKATATDRNETQFSPLFGAVYSPVKTMSFYFNAGKAFAPPSSLVVGERKPEESTQYEIGAKKQFLEGRILTTFAFYNLDKDNIAIPDNNGITQQAGDVRSRGFEMDFNGKPARTWGTYFSYAYNDSELKRFSESVMVGPGQFFVFDRSGNTPAFAPHHILNLWVLHDITNKLQIGGGPRYVSDQFISEDNRFKIDGYVTLDAAVVYSMENWRFRLNFKNLTDQEYESRGFASNSVIPANPFGIYAGIDFHL